MLPHSYYKGNFFYIYFAGEEFPSLVSQLSPVCQSFAETGTPKMAKQAIRCLHLNLPGNASELMSAILEVFSKPIFIFVLLYFAVI